MATPTREDRIIEQRLRVIDDSLQIAVDNFRYFNSSTLKNSKYNLTTSEIKEIENMIIKAKNRVRRLTE